MIATAFLIVCQSLLTTVPMADEAPQPVQRATASAREWVSPLGSLRQATLTGVGTVGDLLLAADSRNGLTSIDPATGAAIWFVQLPAPLTRWGWPVPGDGMLALSCGQDVLVVSANTGSRKYLMQSSAIPCNTPTADAFALYVPTLVGHRVVTMDMATGQQAWEYQMAAPITTPAQLIGPVGARSVLVGCQDGVLRALPAGLAVPKRERWVARVGSIIDWPVIAGDLVAVASMDRVLYALDAASGAIEWTYLPGDPLRSRPVVLGDLICCRTDSKVFAVHASTGQLAWEQELKAEPRGELDGRLLVIRADGSGELRDAATGASASDPLPENVVSSHGRLIELRDHTDVVAYKLKL